MRGPTGRGTANTDLRLLQHLRQLGEVRRHPPRLVARRAVGGRVVRSSDMCGIVGEVEVCGFRTKCR